MRAEISDALVGSMIGAVGSLNGISLPGLLLVGLGFDLSASLVYLLNPNWFPHQAKLTVRDVVTTAIGTTVGWAVVKTVAPEGNPKLAPYAAGLAMLPMSGRMHGRMRAATYRGGR